MGRVYEYKAVVTSGDTNLLQNMYFVHFFRLTGVTRELFVRDCVSDGVADLKAGLTLITREASCSFRKDFFLYDPFVVQLQFVDLKRTHTRLRFRFCHEETGQLHAESFNTMSSPIPPTGSRGFRPTGTQQFTRTKTSAILALAPRPRALDRWR